MKKSLYELLGVEKNASQALIDAAYQIGLKHIEEKIHSGHPEAVNEKVVLKDAYDTLSNPEKRAAYNLRLDEMQAAKNYAPYENPVVIYADDDSATEQWWQSTLFKRAMIGLAIFGTSYLALGVFNTMMAKRMVEKSIDRAIESQRKSEERMYQLEREATYGDRDVPSSTASTDAATTVDFNAINNEALKEQNRLERELKAREYELAREKQRRDSEARAEELALQREQYQEKAAQRKEEAAQERKEREAQYRADKENKYYACLNPAINRYGYDRALIMCSHYK